MNNIDRRICCVEHGTLLVVLGGRIRGCHVEQHDVRWVVGATIEDTLPTLRQEWIGLRSGLHIDSYRLVRRVDGHRVTVKTQPEPSPNTTKPLLWFVNLGAYTPRQMSEQHHFGLVVADSAIKAKHRVDDAGCRSRTSPQR